MSIARDTTPWTTPRCVALRLRDERLQALDQTVSRLVHDFNNLQAPLLGYVTLLHEEVGNTSPCQDYLDAMARAGRHSEHVLERMLEAVRPQRLFRRAPVDFRDLIQKEVDTWQAQAKHGAIDLRTNLCPGTLNVDARHWRRVVMELLDNAAYGLAGGGTLEVTLSQEPLNDDQAAELGVEGRPVFRLTFRDSGKGMSPELVARAFDALFTTRKKEKSLGVGLTLAHAVTRLHGGQVILESEEGHGTTVSFWIPDSEERAPAHVAAPAASPSPARAKLAGRTVLAVDDDPMILETLENMLRPAGVNLLRTTDAAAALAAYDRQKDAICLAICDVVMPDRDGYELAAELRAANPKLPVLFISGDVKELPPEVLRQVPGPQPLFLKKPFTVQSLLDATRSAIGAYSSPSFSRKP